MNSLVASFRTLDTVRRRFGLLRATQHAVNALVNRLGIFDVLHVIVLERDGLQPPPDTGDPPTCRLATRADLETLRRDPRFDIDDEKIAHFEAGNCCLLSYLDGQLAGFTWVDTTGRPELIPGLVVAVPRRYLYNYSALTLPEFRGRGLQPHRHRALLEHERWRDRQGLLGFVRYTNFGSQSGQRKSGYRRIGWIAVVGAGARFALFSKSLRDMGFSRVSARLGTAVRRAARRIDALRPVPPSDGFRYASLYGAH